MLSKPQLHPVRRILVVRDPRRKMNWTRRILIVGYSSVLGATVAATAIMFPWSVDPQGDESFQAASRGFYDKAYSTDPQSGKDDVYKESAERATLITRTPEIAAEFVNRYGLKNKKILEVGAGSGLLQDIVDDYTALEISRSARRFFHKPFVEASATHMPFSDNTFDGLWTFRVLEHIPNPERALLEMRRVVKPGGYILLHLYVRQVRLLRYLGSRIGGGPSRLHFIKLNANYDKYWTGDSDAPISLSYHEARLWFTSRGDDCEHCSNEWDLIFKIPLIEPYMFIRVNK